PLVAARMTLHDEAGIAVDPAAEMTPREATLIQTLSQDTHFSRVCAVGTQSYVHRGAGQPPKGSLSTIPIGVLPWQPHKTSPSPAVFFLPHTIPLHLRPKPVHSGFSFR